jgi:hypothetical protein
MRVTAEWSYAESEDEAVERVRAAFDAAEVTEP